MLPRATALLLPFIAGGAALGIYADTSWRFAAGMLFGAGVTMLLLVRDLPPQFIENWADGASGERRTERALRELANSGWVIRHDVPGRRKTNIDDVAVGLPGIFLLDTKVRRGRLEVRGEQLVAKRLGIDEFTHRQKLGAVVANAAHDLWIDLGGRRASVPRVAGAAVIWGDRVEIAEAERFAFVPGPQLAGWLAAKSPALSAGTIDHVVDQLDALIAQRTAASEAIVG